MFSVWATLAGLRPRATARASLAHGTTISFGMAKPMFSIASPASLAELMPTKLPLRSTSGPPLLPGLIAASVWSRFA